MWPFCTDRLLLRMGANPTLTDCRGYTPLHVSAYAGNEDSSALLLQNGASPNRYGHKPDFYQTPFHRASSGGVIKAFLQNGGDAFLPMESKHPGATKRQSVFDVLLEKQPQAVVEFFEHGISINGDPMDYDSLLIIFDYELFYRQGVMDTMIDKVNANQSKEVPNDPPTSTTTERCDEMAVHHELVKYDTGNLLKHPLSESFLHIKWELTKPIVYAILLFFLSFAILLTSETAFEAGLLKCNVTGSNDTGAFNLYGLHYFSCSTALTNMKNYFLCTHT